MILNNREFLIWKERGRGCERERERGGLAGRRVGIFNVRFGRDREIEGRYIDTERQRDIETELTIKIPSKAG